MSDKLYNILGISKTASEGEIKSAYRKLARKYHPDVNKDNPQSIDKFKEVTKAYEILADKDKRVKYDNSEIDEDGKPTPFGAGFGGGYGGGSTGGNPFGQGSAGFDFSSMFGEDIFSAFTGGGPQQRPRNRGLKGQDVSYEMSVDFLDAANGAEKPLLINGKNINVKIPAGTISGQVLRLKEMGYAGSYGGKYGDALITINVRSHKFFEIDGNNILLELPLSMKEAILGAKITVPTISGNVNVNIPPYASSGEKLRLKGRGIKVRNQTGDQIISLKIVSPKEKNSDLEDILKSMNEEKTRDF